MTQTLRRVAAVLALLAVALFGATTLAPAASADSTSATWGRVTGHYENHAIHGTVFDTKYDGACAVVRVNFGTGYTRNAYIAGGWACGYNTGSTYSITNGWAADHTYGIRMYQYYKGSLVHYATLCGSGPACRDMG